MTTSCGASFGDIGATLAEVRFVPHSRLTLAEVAKFGESSTDFAH